MVGHFADQKVKDGGFFLGYRGLHEYLHIIFKQEYKKSKSRSKAMDDSIAVVRRRMCDDARTATRKRPKNLMDEDEKEMLSVPRPKACSEYRYELAELI